MSGEDTTAVDGGGRNLVEHCKHLAEVLKLNATQTEILVSELRNALVPVEVMHVPRLNGVRRVLELARALHQLQIDLEARQPR